MMDKELLRLVIFAIGGLVVLGIIILHIVRKNIKKRSIDFYDKGNPLDNIDQSLVLNTSNDDFDIVPIGSAGEDIPVDADVLDDDVFENNGFEDNSFVPTPSSVAFTLPNIIQFSLVATADEGFNGEDLFQAFERVGLEFGSMKVFERLDDQRRVDFAVASMVEPGTFPDEDFVSFNCPGIVFFLQPGELETPLAIFDDFIQTMDLLAIELDGVKWDHERQPLTDETVHHFRMALS